MEVDDTRTRRELEVIWCALSSLLQLLQCTEYEISCVGTAVKKGCNRAVDQRCPMPYYTTVRLTGRDVFLRLAYCIGNWIVLTCRSRRTRFCLGTTVSTSVRSAKKELSGFDSQTVHDVCWMCNIYQR